jgi:IclR family transcriptional regulator, acetate operon repressor
MLRVMPSTAQSAEGPSIHNAVDRAMRVLTFLGARPQGASLLEISTSTSIPKPSLHRTLTAMRGRGYASQPEPGGPYLLGPAVLEAAFTFHAGLDLRRLLHPLAAKVRDHFRQTCHVVVLDGAQVTYIDKVEADIAVRLTSVIGGRNPAHATGVGKALLADTLPDAEAVRDWVAEHGPLAQRTSHTLTTAPELARALDEVRVRGWALDDQESEDGLACVATRVPLVFGPLTPPVAISVTGLHEPLVRYGTQRAGRELLDIVNAFEFGAHSGAQHPGAPEAS